MIKIKGIHLSFYAACLCALWSGVYASDKPVKVPVFASPLHAGAFVADSILMTWLIRNHYPVVLVPQESPGFIYNIRAMQNPKNWRTTIFNTSDSVILLSFQGGEGELNEFFPEKVDISFKLLYGHVWWGGGKVFITYDKNLTSLSQLQGKRVSIGLRTQIDWGLFPTLLLKYGYGITSENMDLRYLTVDVASRQLMNHSTDVTIGGFGTEPGGKQWWVQQNVQEIGSVGKKMYYLGFEKNKLEKLNEIFGAIWVPIDIPAGTLPYQDAPLESAASRSFKAAHLSFPEELAYQVVMAVVELAPKLKQHHPLWELWSPQLMLSGLTEENIHPGAKRAFQELGWWDDRSRELPMVFPQ